MQTVNSLKNVLPNKVENDNVFYNLSVSQLVEASVERKEGKLTATGALHAYTGEFTGRSPKDKYIVREPSVDDRIAWGNVNQPISQENFERLYQKAITYMNERELFVFDGKAGADTEQQLAVRVINEYAWHNLFSRQLFIEPKDETEQNVQPDFTVISLPGLEADPVEDGTNSETFIIISFEKRIVLIGGTAYAGEIKKSIFSVLNYLLPLNNVLPMHCSANVNEDGNNVALFFGLSGTGKTTLSADTDRRLIGDDEHGWTDKGIYNFEGGCYAKCIGLSKEKEPQIWNAINYGSVVENVTLDPNTRQLDFEDDKVTENTRVAYTLEKIPNAIIPGESSHPEVIIFLTADAFGVLPPISKLTKEQAMYHFLSGYTSKLAGTERGITEPKATFSTCFGEPFLPHRPDVYAKLLGEKIDQHQARVYLVNTGWTGGPYGVGQRMELQHTRTMVSAAISGELEQTDFYAHPTFGVLIPETVRGVPDRLLDPRKTWAIPRLYDEKAKDLAKRFVENFNRFSDVSPTIQKAGPRVK